MAKVRKVAGSKTSPHKPGKGGGTKRTTTAARKPRAFDLAKTARRVVELKATDLVAGLLWVVVFGPGHGEAILVRLPDGRVGIVDGCREPESDCPVTKLLVELRASSLLFACLTHPHEDHYRGLARLLAKNRGKVSHVWHVFALTANDQKGILRYAKHLRKTPGGRWLPDVGEWKRMEAVFKELMEATVQPVAAELREMSIEKTLFRESVSGSDLEIVAWGPSDLDVSQARLKFAARNFKQAVKKDDLPNQVSGAMLLRWGTSRVLLAGDLYRNSNSKRGWGPARKPAQVETPVQVVNVAHHASHNAHDSELWNAMQPRLAIVTPFLKANLSGGKPCQPPRPDDIERLLDSMCEVAITSKPAWLGKPLTPLPPKGRNHVGAAMGPRAGGIAASPHLHSASGAPDSADAGNGVAVALDSAGNIVEVILAGAADFYY